MSLPFSSYLSQILMKLLETLISLQGIKISIYVCNAHEVILFLFGTINFTTKDQLQPVWTSFFCVVDRLGLVFKGPVAIPEYVKWSRPVAVASWKNFIKHTFLSWISSLPFSVVIFLNFTLTGSVSYVTVNKYMKIWTSSGRRRNHALPWKSGSRIVVSTIYVN